MFRKYLLIAGGLFFLALTASGQNISMRFTHITLEDGLSQSTINDILQDSKGFLWFATEDGLNRYNGYTFTVFKNEPGNPYSISNNSISDIIEDQNGDIWVATRGGGLNRFDRETERFEHFKPDENDSTSLSDSYVTALFEDRSGVILVGTQSGLNIYEPQKRSFLHYTPDKGNNNSLKGEWITSIFEDHDGILWIGTQDNGLNRFDRANDRFTHYGYDPADPTSLSDNWVVTVYEDRENNLWVGTQSGGLSRLNRETQEFKRFKHDPNNSNSLSHNWVLTMYEDRYGEFWVGTLNGLNIFDRRNDRFIDVTAIKGAPDLNNKSINSLFEDRSGVFWVGTKDDALHKFVRSTEYFTIYEQKPGSPLSLSENNVWAVREMDDGSLWIGTQGGGLNVISPDREEISYYTSIPEDSGSLSDNFVNSIFQDKDGTIWVGTINGLNEYIPSEDAFRHYRHDPNDPTSLGGDIITTIYEDKIGTLWVGTLNNGLSQLDKSTGTFTTYKSEPGNVESLSHNKIWSFYEDRNGVFWVGTHGYGLNKYDRANDQFRRYVHRPADSTSISNNFINFIYQDSQQRYWIGTLNGLNRFNPRSETFKSYSTEDGLPNNVIYGMIEDDRGHLWMSSNNGISDFNPETGEFRNYDVGDGLPGNEYRFGAYHRGNSGTMYFGGINGVVSFESDSIRQNPHIPPVVFTQFEIYNRPVDINSGSILEKSITETEEINLSYREQVFSFEFSGLHYAAPSQNSYAYMMEGFDEEWQYIGNRRFVSFTSMPPAEYTLRVKAANKDGVWNNEGTSIRINIAPPPWQTWWAYVVYGFITLLTVGGFIQYRIEKERKKKKHLESQNEELETLVVDRTKELLAEKEKSDTLLYNILPREVAEELKDKGTTTPRRFEDATILFCDFQGFTSAAASMPADRLVNELNDIFQHFDGIIESYGLEKIKTIGDAYMAAGGIPSEHENHALKCVEAALTMLEYIEERNSESSYKWEMRVGMHSGGVVAGVVGRVKFTYDLWGDTVILASRLEAAGEAGKINISASTHALIKEYYDCKYRGKVQAEGKGKIDMYFVVDRLEDAIFDDMQIKMFENQ